MYTCAYNNYYNTLMHTSNIARVSYTDTSELNFSYTYTTLPNRRGNFCGFPHIRLIGTFIGPLFQ